MNQSLTDPQALKAAIAEDIETLKKLDVEILPASDYYKANGRLFLYVFLRIYGTVLGGCIVPSFFYWKDLMSMGAFTYLLELMGAAFVLCAFAFLFIYSSLNHYVLIKYQLRDKLKTGDVLVDKLRLAGNIAYGIFAAVVLILSLFIPPGASLHLAFGGFFVSGIGTSIVVEMETNRIGISALFTLVQHYFDKDKTVMQTIQKR